MTLDQLHALRDACDKGIASHQAGHTLEAAPAGTVPPWLATILTILAQVLPTILPLLGPTPTPVPPQPAP